LLNTSAFISFEPSYKNNTEIKYKDNNKFELCFINMDKKYFIFDLQIKINIIFNEFNEFLFKEDSLVYTLPIDLTNELKDNALEDYLSKNKINLIIIFIIVVIIIYNFVY